MERDEEQTQAKTLPTEERMATLAGATAESFRRQFDAARRMRILYETIHVAVSYEIAENHLRVQENGGILAVRVGDGGVVEPLERIQRLIACRDVPVRRARDDDVNCPQCGRRMSLSGAAVERVRIAVEECGFDDWPWRDQDQPAPIQIGDKLFVAQLDDQELAVLERALDKVTIDCTFG